MQTTQSRSTRRLGGAELALAVLLVLAACVLGGDRGVLAVPAYDFLFKGPADQPPSQIADDNECYSRPDVETLCQRCAKLTKSNVVYPMCCEDREEAREWCSRYLNFGIK